MRCGLEVSPDLRAGVGLVHGGAGTALVGNPQQVADRNEEDAALGLDRFIFSGYPRLEEVHRFAERVFPVLPLALRDERARPALAGSFDEMIANAYMPKAA